VFKRCLDFVGGGKREHGFYINENMIYIFQFWKNAVFPMLALLFLYKREHDLCFYINENMIYVFI